MSLIGYMVQWRNSFREHNVLVFDHNESQGIIKVWEKDIEEVYDINIFQIKVVKLRPALQDYIAYSTRDQLIITEGEIENSESNLAIMMKSLDKIRDNGDKIMNEAKSLSREEMKRQYSNKEEYHSDDNKFMIRSPRSPRGQNDGNDSKIECDNNDENVDDSSEDGDQSNDEDDSDESSEEESESDDSSEDSEESDSESENEEQDNVAKSIRKRKVDIKVLIMPVNRAKGFNINMKSGFNIIKKQIQKDFKLTTAEKISFPKLEYTDLDGDIFDIKKSKDFEFVIRCHLKIENRKDSVLKIVARLPHIVNANNNSNNHSSLASSQFKATKKNFRGTDTTGDNDSGGFNDTSYLGSTIETLSNEFGRDSLNSDTETFPHWNDETRGKDTCGNSENFSSSFKSLFTTAKNIPEHELLFGETGQDHSFSTRSIASSLMLTVLPSDIAWQKGDMLGSGSFGRVFRGLLANGTRIAIKEVDLGKGQKAEGTALAIQREVQILSKLHHKNIVKYLGTDYSDDTIRILLELSPDGTIKDILNEFGALPEHTIRRYSVDIVAGLIYLHHKGITHRDIKPTNLLVFDGVIKLADFGCSSISAVEGSANSEHLNGTLVGTTTYMSPEVMQSGSSHEGSSTVEEQKSNADTVAMKNRRRDMEMADSVVTPHKSQNNDLSFTTSGGYGRKTDIWSLGITLVEMATGKSPFRNAASAIFRVCVAKDYPVFPPEFSPEAHVFLSKCLVEDFHLRASAKELNKEDFLQI